MIREILLNQCFLEPSVYNFCTHVEGILSSYGFLGISGDISDLIKYQNKYNSGHLNHRLQKLKAR